MLVTFVTCFLLFYLWHAMGITIGYHRLLSHRSFRCPKAVEYFWVLGGYLAFQGPPIWWAVTHRAHHRYSDTPLDPHSPRQRGWRYAYYGWMLNSAYADHVDPQLQAKDLIADPIYRFLERSDNMSQAPLLNAAISILFRVILLFTCGWVVALASLLAGFIVMQVPLLLNVICHQTQLGYKNFETSDDSVNVWWVAMLAAGEGWHNNHHAIQGSARSGIKPWEFDLSWQTIRLMHACGLVSWLNQTTEQSKVCKAPHTLRLPKETVGAGKS